ncbi:hypothetical protein QR680_015648 [Steinernema hermaphroditum]|uniref:Uncharacterized protein n=1 Tax=Steinernema hermaphroditum TaxID=289476 RepID=A0AA39HB45_9BILA|nr:hypothetical protein QR680_015648 [Steinernema hermaphroditum]
MDVKIPLLFFVVLINLVISSSPSKEISEIPLKRSKRYSYQRSWKRSYYEKCSWGYDWNGRYSSPRCTKYYRDYPSYHSYPSRYDRYDRYDRYSVPYYRYVYVYPFFPWRQ